MADRDEQTKAQFRNPNGDEGRKVLESMNDHHVPLWEFCLSKLPRSMDGAVLDVGCGGGGFLRRLSDRYPFAMLFGVDISRDALEMTASVNSETYESGGLELHEASVESLPFQEGSFDMVTAMEAYFFWPDFGKGVAEISRVLSPGGVLAIGSEIRYGDGDDDRVDSMCEEYGMRILRDDEILAVLDSNGIDAEAIPGEHGVLYRGVKRFRFRTMLGVSRAPSFTSPTG